MRLLVLTTSYPRFRGDFAGGFVEGFARWLAREGHGVTVVAAGDAAAPERSLSPEGIRVLRVRGEGLFFRGGAPEALASARVWARVPGFVARLAARAVREAADADAIVSHWIAPSGLVGCAIAGGRPHLAIAHSGDVHLCERVPALGGAAARALAATGARCAFVSEDLRARFLARAGERAARILRARSTVAPMGIDAASLAPGAPREAVAGRLRVLFLGRLVPIKGVRHLARACAGLAGVELHVAGEGPEARHLSARASRGPRDAEVVLHGVAAGAARRELLALAGALCVPSIVQDGRSEGAPLAAIEALAAGLPVIATRTGGLPEIVRDGETGLLVPPGDEAALRGAIVRLRDDLELRARLSAAAARAGARHDWSEAGPRLLSVLRPLRAINPG